MRYVDVYNSLTRIANAMPSAQSADGYDTNIDEVALSSLLEIITAEMYASYEALEYHHKKLMNRIYLLQEEYAAKNRKLAELRARHHFILHKVISKKTTLQNEQKQIVAIECKCLSLKKELEQLRKEADKGKNELLDHAPASYVQITNKRYVRLNDSGRTTLTTPNKLLDLPFDSSLPFNLGALMTEGKRFTGNDPFSTNHTESVVQFIPALIRLSEKTCAANSPTIYTKNKNLPCSKPITSFFATLTYPSAVPYLLNALKSQVFTVELHEKVLKTEERSEYFDAEGTNGGGKGYYNSTYDTVEQTHICRSPVAEGAKIALLRVRDANPELSDLIDDALTCYEETLTLPKTNTQEVFRRGWTDRIEKIV
ncbi:MAG: hypothetical protein ACFFDN_31680 [Candidatus Hodarchaeota archaeon]